VRRIDTYRCELAGIGCSAGNALGTIHIALLSLVRLDFLLNESVVNTNEDYRFLRIASFVRKILTIAVLPPDI